MHLTSIMVVLLWSSRWDSALMLGRSRLFSRVGAGSANGVGDALRKTDRAELVSFPDQVQRAHLPLESAQQLSAVVIVGEERVHDLAQLRIAVGGDGIGGAHFQVPACAVDFAQAGARVALFLVFTPRAGVALTRQFRAGDKRHFYFLEGGAEFRAKKGITGACPHPAEAFLGGRRRLKAHRDLLA